MREAIVAGPVINTAKRVIDALDQVDVLQDEAHPRLAVIGELEIVDSDGNVVARVRWDNEAVQWVLAVEASKTQHPSLFEQFLGHPA